MIVNQDSLMIFLFLQMEINGQKQDRNEPFKIPSCAVVETGFKPVLFPLKQQPLRFSKKPIIAWFIMKLIDLRPKYFHKNSLYYFFNFANGESICITDVSTSCHPQSSCHVAFSCLIHLSALVTGQQMSSQLDQNVPEHFHTSARLSIITIITVLLLQH